MHNISFFLEFLQHGDSITQCPIRNSESKDEDYCFPDISW
nr:MAG TPA: hypothetical protein [Caudoviricetes sp.]